ncbi:MAG TPA: AI-2E family transporter [Sphingomonas sp.]|nr:AI-2E family transporter [Sphingomonas sp.]
MEVTPVEVEPHGEDVSFRRDRLLASLTLIAGAGLLFALPFALQAARAFFLPVTAAMIIAIALVPLLEGLQNRRVPSGLAALICVVLFVAVVNVALAAIVVPASEWVTLLPQRLSRIQSNIAPVLELFQSLQHFVDRIVKRLATGPVGRPATPAVAPPNSVLQLLATSAPSVLIEMFYALLLVFFFLAGWTSLKRRTITSRTSIHGAVTTARVLRDVVSATSSYLGTITMVNMILGLIVAGALWLIGLPSPLMWGGLVTIFNYIPYLGPIFAAVLLTLGGLMSFTDIWLAFTPPAIMIGLHLVEANAITPMLVGRRVKINPLLILISISFWGWVWGPLGALLATPLLIIIQRVIAAAGLPDITGFLFEEGMLTHLAEPDSAP